MTNHEGLIARLEAAEAGSRGLDALIAVALDIRPDWLLNSDGRLGVFDGRLVWLDRFVRKPSAGNPPVECAPFTTSLDAALALAERVLPVNFSVEVTAELGVGFGWAEVTPEGRAYYETAEEAGGASAHARSPALALCITILHASDTLSAAAGSLADGEG